MKPTTKNTTATRKILRTEYLTDFDKARKSLSEEDQSTILAIVSYRCHLRTKRYLDYFLTSTAPYARSYGIYSRLMKDRYHYDDGTYTDRWSYCAGQDYTSEIKTLRECMLGRI